MISHMRAHSTTPDVLYGQDQGCHSPLLPSFPTCYVKSEIFV